jgi:hypothetical protein
MKSVKGKLVGCGITEITINGDLKFKSLMKFKSVDDDQIYYWEAFLHKKDGTKNTYCEDQMKNVGFNGVDNAESVVKFSEGVLDDLNTEKVFDLQIEIEKSKDGSKTYEKIKWINDPDNPNQGIKKANTNALLEKLGLSQTGFDNSGDKLPF